MQPSAGPDHPPGQTVMSATALRGRMQANRPRRPGFRRMRRFTLSFQVGTEGIRQIMDPARNPFGLPPIPEPLRQPDADDAWEDDVHHWTPHQDH